MMQLCGRGQGDRLGAMVGVKPSQRKIDVYSRVMYFQNLNNCPQGNYCALFNFMSSASSIAPGSIRILLLFATERI